MTRKRIDAAGNIVDVPDSPPHGVVGNIEPPVTDPLELPNTAMRADSPAAVGWRFAVLVRLTDWHVRAARFVRRRVLLMGDIDFGKTEQALNMVADQHRGFSKMLHEVRTRLVFHERSIPLLGESRRRWDAQQIMREKDNARDRAERRGEKPTA